MSILNPRSPVWRNTKTLDEYISDVLLTSDREIAHLAIIGSKPIVLDDFPQLRAIFRVGVSRDNVPIEEAEVRNIIVRFPSRKVCQHIYEETANYACSLIFKMNYQNVGDIERWEKRSRRPLSSKLLLVVGMGHIGELVAAKMSQFMGVIGIDLENVSECEEDIQEADFVSLHIPGSEENKNFIDAKKLSLMKDGAVLINTARGSVVDENALLQELLSGRISAAFDTFWQEPYKGPLTRLRPDRFYMSPHIASTNTAFLEGCREELGQLLEEIQT